jgi:hypothetical protein
MNKSAKIFLSHSSKDKAFVRKLASDLKSNDVPVWFDEWELKVGDSINQKIGEGINESGWLAVVISNNSIKSSWVEKELNAGLATELQKRQVFVLPIVIDNCDIPIFLRDKLFADFRSDYSSGLNSLLTRLIPEKPLPIQQPPKSSVEIHRQRIMPKPEEFLISITDVKILRRNSKYSGLFDVKFILNQHPEQDWCVLFNHPTSSPISIHPAKVINNEIYWMASEENIKLSKHWIYDWIDDANKRYLSIAIKKIAVEENRIRDSQLDNARIAELESILKVGSDETLISLTEEVIVGKCMLRLDGCSTQINPGPITQINFENQGYFHVCYDCLQRQLDNKKWKAR